MSEADEPFVGDTRRWLERAVIGLNLCPFAKAVHAKQQVHYAVSQARDPQLVLHDVGAELDGLVAHREVERETTLLIVPHCLEDFLQFNDFMAQAERFVRRRGLEGVIQLASFHPRFQFQGTEADDIGNFTNRSPYPVVHLLREASIDRAVQAFPEAGAIYETNIETMRRLGAHGWEALRVGPSQ
jgi:uncharacterized protein